MGFSVKYLPQLSIIDGKGVTEGGNGHQRLLAISVENLWKAIFFIRLDYKSGWYVHDLLPREPGSFSVCWSWLVVQTIWFYESPSSEAENFIQWNNVSMKVHINYLQFHYWGLKIIIVTVKDSNMKYDRLACFVLQCTRKKKSIFSCRISSSCHHC